MINLITEINQSQTLPKHISCKSICKFDRKKVTQINDRITINVTKKNEKYYIWYLCTYSCENGKYFASIMSDSAILCDKSQSDQETKTIHTNFKEKEATCKTQNFYILLAFLFITIALLIAVSIYCYLIYYFFDDIINTKNFDLNNIKIDENSSRYILIYCINYVTIKDLNNVKINSVNPLYLIFGKVDV